MPQNAVFAPNQCAETFCLIGDPEVVKVEHALRLHNYFCVEVCETALFTGFVKD